MGRVALKTAPETVWHQLPLDAALRQLDVVRETGLSLEEATRRQHSVGLNRITARPGTPLWRLALRQFNQPLILILIVAVVVTALLGEWVDSAVILAVVLLNALVGFIQEAKAGKAIDSLSQMVATETSVRRDGRTRRIHSEQLVPGDVVLLQAGDRVPADLRLAQLKNLHVDESALTGESLPVAKHARALAADTVLGDRKNLAFTGTLVTAGHGEGIVFATADHTETGHIARLIGQAVDLSTPLTRKIAQLSQWLLWAILILAAAIIGIGVVRGEPLVDAFMAAVALAVGAIPEGLPAAVTVVLAIGVARMAQRRAIIRKLPAVETLGSTTIICSDKTGTLTQNQMTVREVFAGGTLYEVTGTGYEARGEIRLDGVPVNMADHPAMAECLRAGVLNNDAQIVRQNGQLEVVGDPTEAALLVAGEKGGLPHADTHRASPRVDVIPFDSEHMFRATLHDSRAGGRVIYKSGAVERLLPRCVDELGQTSAPGQHAEPQPLDHAAVQRTVEAMAARGLRVLALVRRRVAADHATLEPPHVAAGLTFLGLQGMIDPPRPEAIDAVRQCQAAGIEVKMITGDHLVTARAIAAQIGLHGRGAQGELRALSGRELEKLSDAELPDVAEHTAVFARVAPEQKLRLVRALQSRGHVVAMTGDGVNDAPALKQADIGIAMGVSGTEVAKSAAAMVLTDDNFASIVAAVEEGRGVFDNLTKFIVWTLPTNAGAALILLTAIALGLTLPALPVQWLWINMTSAVLLGLTLVFERKEPGLMQRPPRDPKTPLLTPALLLRTGLVSLLMLAGAYWLFLREMRAPDASLVVARTSVINLVVVVEIAYLANCRSLHHGFFSVGFFSNRWLIAGVLAMLAAQWLFTYAPWMNRLFHSAPTSGESWLRIAGVAGVVFVLVEIEKAWRKRQGQTKPALPA